MIVFIERNVWRGVLELIGALKKEFLSWSHVTS